MGGWGELGWGAVGWGEGWVGVGWVGLGWGGVECVWGGHGRRGKRRPRVAGVGGTGDPKVSIDHCGGGVGNDTVAATPRCGPAAALPPRPSRGAIFFLSCPMMSSCPRARRWRCWSRFFLVFLGPPVAPPRITPAAPRSLRGQAAGPGGGDRRDRREKDATHERGGGAPPLLPPRRPLTPGRPVAGGAVRPRDTPQLHRCTLPPPIPARCGRGAVSSPVRRGRPALRPAPPLPPSPPLLGARPPARPSAYPPRHYRIATAGHSPGARRPLPAPPPPHAVPRRARQLLPAGARGGGPPRGRWRSDAAPPPP